MVSKPSNPLSRFESLAERWLEGGFARLFGARLHPAELAEQLARALEDGRAAGPDGVWLAPDDYQVFLHPADYARLDAQSGYAEIEEALAGYLLEIAQQSGATLPTRPKVHLLPSDRVPPHQVQVQARLTVAGELTEPPADTQEICWQKARNQTTAVMLPPPTLSDAQTPACWLAVGERRVPLTASPVSLGRSLDNDVVVEHPRVSRRHAQLRQREGRWWLIDLGSANGTAVNDQPVSEAALLPGDVISLAGVEILFESQGARSE
jgi:hypothetical protein